VVTRRQAGNRTEGTLVTRRYDHDDRRLLEELPAFGPSASPVLLPARATKALRTVRPSNWRDMPNHPRRRRRCARRRPTLCPTTHGDGTALDSFREPTEVPTPLLDDAEYLPPVLQVEGAPKAPGEQRLGVLGQPLPDTAFELPGQVSVPPARSGFARSRAER